MAWTCIICDKSRTGQPAEQAPNGPVCRKCVADDAKLNARLRTKRKKKRKRK